MEIEEPVLGWCEWVSLPELNVPYIKAKLDTGAKTSALHAVFVEKLMHKDTPKVRFCLQPEQHNDEFEIVCEADLKDERWVRDSGGHREWRPVITTMLSVGDESWPIDVTLSSRETMQFRLLLGRTALHRHAIVDASRSYVTGRPTDPPR